MGDGRAWRSREPSAVSRRPSFPSWKIQRENPTVGLLFRPISSRGLAFALACICLLISSVLGAADRCTIEVDVREDGVSALGGVDVKAACSVLTNARTGITGGDGRVVLVNLPPGPCRLEISREGYQWLEVEDVRCRPDGVVRLVVTLDRAVGDEVVVLPSGPSVDPEGTAVGHLLSLDARELLPPGGGEFEENSGSGLWPKEAVAFQGVIRGGGADEPGPVPITMTRLPEQGIHGRVSIDAGAGLGARTTGTRGDVTAVDNGVRARFSLGGRPKGGRLGTFLALEADRADLDTEANFGSGVSGDRVRRAQPWDRDSFLGYGVLNWSPAPSHRLNGRVNWGRHRSEDMPSSLHVVPDAPLPGGERYWRNRAMELEWDTLPSSGLAVQMSGGFSVDSLDWRPARTGILEQDQSPEGNWSGGLGNGIWSGEGGVAAFDRDRETLHGGAGLEWSLGSGHRLEVAASWSREDQDLQYLQPSEGQENGTRRIFRGPVAQRIDTLESGTPYRGRLETGRIVLRDSWRVAGSLSLLLGLETEDLRFDGGESRPGYHFAVDDMLSPRVGLVWDFEGSGRSRAWIQWARFRQGPGAAVQLRLGGALDVSTVFIDDDGSSRERLPGLIDVAPDLEPATIDETVVGVEYEVLSHLVVGVAGVFRRTENGLAVLSEDGGGTFLLDSPSGDTWSSGLDSEVVESWGWIRKRLANGWQAEVRVGWRRSRGTWSGPQGVDLVDVNREYLADVVSPEALNGARGPLPDDRRWHLELSGSWLFAAGPSLGGRLTYTSGAPVSRLGALTDGLGLDRRFVEGRGSAGRTPELWQADLVGLWPFEIGRGRFEAFVELRNLFDSQRAVVLDERWTVLDGVQAAGLEPEDQRTDGTWGQTMIRQHPMELRAGLTYRW